MSRVLLLVPSSPLPADTGARMRNAALVRALGEVHEVDVLGFGRPSPQSALPGARLVRFHNPPRERGRATRLRHAAVERWPDMAMRLWSPDFARLIDHHAYDVVQAEGIEMARYLAAAPRDKRVYDAHNAEFLFQRRFAELAPSLAGSIYSRLQWHRLEAFERAIVRASRFSLAVSMHDANQLRALAGPLANVHVVPNAIDVAAYPFSEPRCTTSAGRLLEVAFVGKLDFRPNAEAVRWFIECVLPSIDARLFAVGAAPPSWLVRAGQQTDRIAVTGYVADERPYLRRCDALVLPMRYGGGSRLKALVALASGLPIVSTALGMEGIDAEPDVHFLQAHSTAEWVAALRRLSDEPELRTRLACAGRRLVQDHYDWTAIRPRVREVYGWLR